MSESTTLDITDDLTETQLAEAAFTEEIVVYWQGTRARQYGIIVGYNDPGDAGPAGLFRVDEVIQTVNRDGEDTWEETGDKPMLMGRADFVVFGPANRDPGDRPQEPHEVAIEVLKSIRGFDTSLTPFLCAAIEIAARTQEHDSSTPAFNVRLDIKHVDTDGQGYRTPWRRNRITVRATEDPMMHNEIEWVLDVASKYELSGFHSNVGIDIRRPDDSV